MKFKSAILILLVGSMLAISALAEESGPGRFAATAISTEATVESVDHNARYVTLKNEDGKSVTIKVPEFAHNFNHVEKGDKVLMEYTEAFALDVRKSDGSAPSAQEESSIERAPLGANPAGEIVNTRTISAMVEAIDYSKRQITLKGSEGVLVTMTVGPQAKHFDQVKKGEKVVATYTEALAMKLEKRAS